MTAQPSIPGPAPHPAVVVADAIDALMRAGFAFGGPDVHPWCEVKGCITELARQRDQARDIAVALEQEVADYKADGALVGRSERLRAVEELISDVDARYISARGQGLIEPDVPELVMLSELKAAAGVL